MDSQAVINHRTPGCIVSQPPSNQINPAFETGEDFGGVFFSSVEVLELDRITVEQIDF